MASIKISALPVLSTLNTADIISIVDNAVSPAITKSVAVSVLDGRYVLKSGDTMTGALTISSGALTVSAGLFSQTDSTNEINARFHNTNASFTSWGLLVDVDRAANSAYNIFEARSDVGTAAVSRFIVRGDGNVGVGTSAPGGTLAVLSVSATSFVVGPGTGGSTNPVFQIDASTVSQAAGLKLTGATSAGTVALATISSGAATNLTVDALGTGTIGIGTISTGLVTVGSPLLVKVSSTTAFKVTDASSNVMFTISSSGQVLTCAVEIDQSNGFSGGMILKGNPNNPSVDNSSTNSILKIAGGGGATYASYVGLYSSTTQRGLYGFDGDTTAVVAGHTKTATDFKMVVGGTLAYLIDTSSNFYLHAGILMTGKITYYNAITTAGMGIPTIYSAPAISATKIANFTVLTYTPPATAGVYRVLGVITTTSATNTGTVQLTLDYVDSQGTVHTADIIPLCDAAGVIAITKTGASLEFHSVPWQFTINNAATAIVLKVVITGSVSYTVTGSIEQIG